MYSQEVLNVFSKLLEYNRDPGSTLSVDFKGYGVQRPIKAMDNVVEYLQGIDEAAAHIADSLYHRMYQFANRYPNITTGIMTDIQNRVQTVHDTLVSRKDEYISLSSAEEYSQALFYSQYIINAEQVLRPNSGDICKFYMLDMINHILDESDPNSKIIIWDYNKQIANLPGELGFLLKQQFQEDMISIGFNVYEGYFFASILNPADSSYSWPCLLELPAALPNSYEDYLNSADIPIFFLDLNTNINPPGSTATDWIYGPRKMKQINAFFEPDRPASYFKETGLKDLYDIILFIKESEGSELLIY
jgi:erythromycin esterase-like protein